MLYMIRDRYTVPRYDEGIIYGKLQNSSKPFVRLFQTFFIIYFKLLNNKDNGTSMSHESLKRIDETADYKRITDLKCSLITTLSPGSVCRSCT